MSKKIRILVTLFVSLPLILSVEVEPKKEDYLRFAMRIEQKVEDFIKKTEAEKDKILLDLESTISDLKEKIKAFISEKKESPNEKIIELIKKGIEFSRCMVHKVCNKEDNDFKNCRNNKIKLMDTLLYAVEDILGQCPVTIEYVKTLTEDTFLTFDLLNELIKTIVENVDYIDISKIEIMSNLINCLTEKIDEYFLAITAQTLPEKASRETIKELYLTTFQEELSKLHKNKNNVESDSTKDNKLNSLQSEVTIEDVYKEILDVLKEIKESKNNKTMVIIVSCLATIIILIGGFFLYRFIRRRKNSDLIENTKDFVSSENKLN